MTILHPHWQATDEAMSDERRAVSTESHSSKLTAHSPSGAVSRRPAAVLGILLALSTGIVFLQDPGTFTGALTGDRVTVRITTEGFDPVSASVRPGQTIVWKNAATIPHVLVSQTLTGADGTPFQSSPIFPDATGEFTVPLATPAGRYPYISQTDVITGEIVVEAAVTPPAPAEAPPPAIPAPGTQPAMSQPPISAPLEPEGMDAGSLNGSLIPRNPHTAGDSASPFAAAITFPAQKKAGTAPAYGTNGTPAATPATGPAIWMVGALSVAALCVITRRCFGRIG